MLAYGWLYLAMDGLYIVIGGYVWLYLFLLGSAWL